MIEVDRAQPPNCRWLPFVRASPASVDDRFSTHTGEPVPSRDVDSRAFITGTFASHRLRSRVHERERVGPPLKYASVFFLTSSDRSTSSTGTLALPSGSPLAASTRPRSRLSCQLHWRLQPAHERHHHAAPHVTLSYPSSPRSLEDNSARAHRLQQSRVRKGHATAPCMPALRLLPRPSGPPDPGR